MANQATQNYLCPANARKKSYIKACRKAAKEGVAKYRGIYLEPKELGMKEDSSSNEASTVEATHSRRCILREPKEKFELEVLSWNAGGLTSRYFDELLSLLDTQEYRRIRIVSLQETHWSTSSVFSKGNWHVVSSSVSQGRKAGVMTMIHKSLCTLSDLRSNEIIKGRLHQVRLPWQNSHIQVITGYQHVWQSQITKSENIEQRREWSEQLSKSLSRLPQRDRVLVCADFNSVAKRELPWVGPCALPNTNRAKKHLRPINDFCREHNMVALNTFACKRPHTFQNGSTKTQIDFILMRQKDAVHKAKQAKPQHSFPVGATRQGPGHNPIRATVHVPPYRKPQVHKTAFDLSGLEAGFRRRDDRWTAFSAAVSEAVVDASADAWQDIELSMLNVVEQFYPRSGRRPRRVMDINPDYWNKHRTLRQLKAQGQAAQESYNLLKAEIDTEIKQHKKVQQERRREKQEQLLAAAVEDKRHRSHNLSKALKSLAPWKPPDRVSLRDSQGRLLSEQAEADVIKEYSTKVFCQSGGLLPVEQPHPMDITATQVIEHVHSIPLGKAVPRKAAPVAAWRSINEHAARMVAQKLSEDTGEVHLDTHLKDPYVSWLPKPKKPPCKPEHLRPIGVLSVPAKILAGVVREEVSSTVQNKAQNAPQYAYLKKRGTREAILQAVKHLEEAKALAEEGQRRHRLHGRTSCRIPVLGSIVLSLDLSKAFDSVNRQGLMHALEQLGVDARTRQHVQQLHTDTTYHMTISGVPIAVSVTSGIKQGCKLAPILWSALTLALLEQLAEGQALDECEINRLITLFADDFLAKGHFRSAKELEDLLGHFEALLELLGRVGLVTNPGKSQALVQLHGTQAQSVRETYIRKGEEGRELCVSQSVRVPIKRSIVYLGVILSFGNYQDLTLRHRLKQSKEKFNIVRRTLRSTRVLRGPERLAVWQNQVVSSMLYGLDSIGLTAQGLRLLGQRFSADIRFILGAHQISRQYTTQQLIEKYAVKGPKQQVLDRMGSFISSLEDSSDEARQPMKAELHQLVQEKFTFVSQLSDTWEDNKPPDETFKHICPTCGGSFRTWSGLVRHHKARHGDVGKLRKGPKFNIRFDSQNGTAICRGCYRQLASITQLQIHVESGACSNVATLFEARQRMPESADVPDQLIEVYRSKSQGQDAMLSSQNCRDILKQNCVLCGQRILGHKGIKQHIKQVHSTTWHEQSSEVLAQMRTHKTMLSKGSACRYCALRVDAPGRHAEQCVVLLQTYLALNTDFYQIEDIRKSGSGRVPARDQRAVRNVALVTSFANPHQLCYANSVWGLLLHCQAHTVSALNSLQRVWHAFRSCGNIHIDVSQIAAVRGVGGTWRHQAIQEDAGHYLQHILQSEGLRLLEWEARVDLGALGGTLAEDSGTNLLMLNNAEHGDSFNLQEMITAWSRQARVHALTQCGELLLLQLPRYVSDFRDGRPCRIPAEVQAPAFIGLDLEITDVPFKLIGGLLHLGVEPRSGHYRHFMIEDDVAYLGDDFQRPQPASLCTSLIESNVYILAYQRASPPDGAERDAPHEAAHGNRESRW